MTKLLPCPLCGAAFLMGQEPLDNHPIGGMFYIFHDYGSLGSAARDCPVEVSCHFESVEEAVSAWNARTLAPLHEVEVLEAMRSALEPFAAIADEYDDSDDDAHEVWIDAGPEKVIRGSFALRNYRLARAALIASRQSTSGERE
jgi:hypothetical protein